MEILLLALLLILVHPAVVFGGQSHSGACPDNREEFGFALVGYDFKSAHADNFARCFFECSLEERCKSVTYLWNKKECKFHSETKKTKPKDFVENPAATYMDNTFQVKKHSESCKDIMTSGDAQGDGEYPIDPTSSGDPFTVFCDTTTDGGGWTLISRFKMNDVNSTQDAAVDSDSYKEILPNYKTNKQNLLRNGFNQLKIDMGFSQIRFYCFKKEKGRVFHIMTNKNATGENVVRFFTDSDEMPKACGSFTRLPDDNSTLAINCHKWGYPKPDHWGSGARINSKRLYTRPFLWNGKSLYFRLHNNYDCDDKDKSLSLGDTWMIFVR